jgi:enolase-phosphatase E1
VIGAAVLDIEGTTSSTAFVTDVLYPFARERFGSWLEAHGDEPSVRPHVEAIRAEAGDADIVATLNRWVDEDRKSTPLKAIEGWIWDEGFAAGELTSHFYPDAVPGLRRWHEAGVDLWVFSSGSVTAQRAWFGHSPAGDLTGLIRGWWDTENAGPKHEPDSFRRISPAIGAAPAETAFLSDVVAELDAARTAGWRTIGVRRPGDRWYAEGVPGHPEVSSFDEVDALLGWGQSLPH